MRFDDENNSPHHQTVTEKLPDKEDQHRVGCHASAPGRIKPSEKGTTSNEGAPQHRADIEK
jgi:hypothetical protein